ncbi:MAG: DUF4435 domain-containing protein [Devosia sp.]
MSHSEHPEILDEAVDASSTQITLPSDQPGERRILSLPFGSAIAFIGPNGAGKSRMAAWIDQNNATSLYLRARRSVVMPKSYSVAPEDSEYASILAGQRMDSNIDRAKQIRYSEIGERDYFADDDFQRVLNILGSRHATEAVKFRQAYDPQKPPLVAPQSELDKTTEIWHFVLPHLQIDSSNVPTLSITKQTGDEKVTYSPKDLSDGEKAIFYLIGKSMIAPRNSIVVVDEPEMYVHRSIRNILWNRIEKYRRDCVFIYLTHDLDFVKTRQYHKKYVVQNYIGKPKEGWVYSEAPGDASADEALQMTVWGHRQPTLLVEGTFASLDLRILSLVYTDFLIVPAGSCEDVRLSVNALRSQKGFHHQDVFGLIDRDVRTEEEMSKLKRRKIFCLSFKEIENLLVSSECLRAFNRHMGFTSAECTAIEEKILLTLRKKFIHAAEEKSTISAKRKIINLVETNIQSASTTDQIVSSIDEKSISTIISDIRTKLIHISKDGDWNEILTAFSVRKDNFGSIIADALGLKDFATYREKIIRLAEMDDEAGDLIRRALKRHLPKLEA